MSPAKKSAKKKPAKKLAKKSTTKPASKRAAKPAPKATRKPTKASSAKPAKRATKGAALTPIEIEARQLLDDDAAGNIDNVFDIVEDLEAIRKGLPKTSELYPEWKRFYDDCCRIMGESVGM